MYIFYIVFVCLCGVWLYRDCAARNIMNHRRQGKGHYTSFEAMRRCCFQSWSIEIGFVVQEKLREAPSLQRPRAEADILRRCSRVRHVVEL